MKKNRDGTGGPSGCPARRRPQTHAPADGRGPEHRPPMKRVLVIGPNGAGKTTFARALAAGTRLPLTHLDALYWRDGWTHVAPEDFDARLRPLLDAPAWILDGNMSRTLPLRLQYCDTVIWLDYPAPLCLWGTLRRAVQNRGRSLPDRGGFCPERLDRHFLGTVWRFNRDNRPRFRALLAAAPPGVRVVVLKTRAQARAFLRAE